MATPDQPDPLTAESAGGTVRDLVLVALVTVACGVLAVSFEWTETLFAWTRHTERFQLDELAFVLLSLATGLGWFSARRWRTAKRELDRRLVVETELKRILVEQRQLAQQFLELQERERKRLSQELHDEMGQIINAIKLDAVAIRDASGGTARGPARVLERARSIISSTDYIHESVARLIRELRPVGLDELGLSAAIEYCVDGWRPRLSPARLSLALDERIDRLGESQSLALYRAVQEALNNCARHAHATQVDVSIEWHDGGAEQVHQVSLRIEDNGTGVDLTAVPCGMGLVGMRERLAALGGSLCLESAPQSGFRIVARLPAERIATT